MHQHQKQLTDTKQNNTNSNLFSSSLSLSLRHKHTNEKKLTIIISLQTIKAMAFLLPNLQPSLLAQSKSNKDKANLHQTLSPQKPTSQFPISSTTCSSSLQTSTSQVAKVSTPHDKQQQQPKDEFYLNLGLAVRTIREDLPLVFVKDLNYDIYRYCFILSHPMWPYLSSISLLCAVFSFLFGQETKFKYSF